ncbi:MAG: rhodanese-like domain-containing protein [Candidatus Limnocylindrales bacterium]
MPSAPVLVAIESDTLDEPADLNLVAGQVASAPQQMPVVQAVSVASEPTPSAHVVVPAGPTAHIHWIGSFVQNRHPADLYADIVAGTPDLVIVDARYPETYAVEHLPGAINLPWRDLDEAGTAHLSREALYVVYCWNASCHASTRTAQRLEALGFKVKELHGGLQDWKKQGYPTERA